MAAVKGASTSVAAYAAGAVAPCATARATATFGVGARFTSIAAVTCDSGIPTCVAARATVPAVATITYELTGVATVAWRCARAAAFSGVGKTISTKNSGIRTLRRAITEKHVNTRSGLFLDTRNHARNTAFTRRAWRLYRLT